MLCSTARTASCTWPGPPSTRRMRTPIFLRVELPADLFVYDVKSIVAGNGPVGQELQPTAVIPLKAKITNLLALVDGRWLYYLDIKDSGNVKLGRVNTAPFALDREIRLANHTTNLCQSPDGRVLYASATPSTPQERGARPEGKIQMIEAATLEIQKTADVEADPVEIVANDDGMVFALGGEGDGAAVQVVDMKQSQSVVAPGGEIFNVPGQSSVWRATRSGSI